MWVSGLRKRGKGEGEVQSKVSMKARGRGRSMRFMSWLNLWDVRWWVGCGRGGSTG